MVILDPSPCLVQSFNSSYPSHTDEGYDAVQRGAFHKHLPCLDPLRSALGPVFGVYLVSRVAALCRVQSKSSFLSWVNMQMGSSSKLQWNSPGEQRSRTRLLLSITTERENTHGLMERCSMQQRDILWILMRVPGERFVSQGIYQGPNYTMIWGTTFPDEDVTSLWRSVWCCGFFAERDRNTS